MNKSLVIPVFIPHSGCPHQCAFCNQSIITSQASGVPDQQAIHRVIDQYLSYQGNRQRVEIAFFGGNFLGLPSDIIESLLEGVKGYLRNGKIHGIRFSTRPDTITRRKLDLIRPYPITVVELGVQSMNNRVLSRVKRGHTENDTRHAVRMLKEYRYSVGVQVMTGLPGDTPVSLMESTRKVAALEPEVARIYPLLVLKGSLLEQWYRAGEYTPPDLDESISLCKEMLHIFHSHQVRVIRVGLQTGESMADKSAVLSGPWHPAFGHLVFSRMMRDKTMGEIDAVLSEYQKNSDSIIPQSVSLVVHSRSESRLRGDRNENIRHLEIRYPRIDFRILKDDAVPVDGVKVRAG